MGRSRRGFLVAAGSAVAGCLGAPARHQVVCPPSVGTDASVRLGFVGDCMLGRSVNAHWRDGPPDGVWDGLLGRLRSLDGLVANLECCVSDRGRAKDRVYTFRADPDWAIPALDAAGFDAVSLANNHVLDYGLAAFADTRTHLDSAGITHVGAGPDRTAALAPGTFTAGGVDVTVIGLTDRAPAYAAGPDSPGTAFAPLNPASADSRRIVRRAVERALKTDPDILVASVHWGPNWKTRPGPTRRQQARQLIDRGVDVVHGHSAHVVQGVERYRGRPIIYDAGDFIDDYVHKPELQNKWSFLFELVVGDAVQHALELVPIEIADETVHPASPESAQWLRGAIEDRSTGFETPYHRDGAGLRIPLDC